MKTIPLNDFCDEASDLLNSVEQGETYVITRDGQPIAEVRPYADMPAQFPSWKRPGLKIDCQGPSLSSLILIERESYDQA